MFRVMLIFIILNHLVGDFDLKSLYNYKWFYPSLLVQDDLHKFLVHVPRACFAGISGGFDS